MKMAYYCVQISRKHWIKLIIHSYQLHLKNFGNQFIGLVETLSDGRSSFVFNNGFSIWSLFLGRGTRQGDPISACPLFWCKQFSEYNIEVITIKMTGRKP